MIQRVRSFFARSPAYRKVRVLSVILLTIMAIVGLLASVGLFRVQADTRTLMNKSVPAHDALVETELQLERANAALERAANAVDEDERTKDLEDHERAVTKARESWDDFTFVIGQDRRNFVEVAGFEVMRAAWLESAATVKSDVALQAVLLRNGSNSLDFAKDRLDTARKQFTVMIDQVNSLLDKVYEPAISAGRGTVVSDATRTAQALTVVAVVGLLIGLLVSRLSVRAAHAQHVELEQREAEQQADARRAEHEARLARALEFARTERSAIDTVEQAIVELFPQRDTELLLADSSRAHLRQALVTNRDLRSGCTVATPHDCPAVTKGHPLQFDSSSGYDVCPHLRDRGIEDRSAVCVPVSINGTATGVLHSLGAVNQRVDRESLDRFELIAARAGDRIGVLRAFNRSETQAATDPLTGLMNRRSFENEIGAMLGLGTRFTIAYGDLDQFKSINDRHGHPTGDRALRIFSRIVRENVRPQDLCARWGGEEFVIAFPDTPLRSARRAIERIQASLREMVEAGLLPPLTVSFGMCDWTSGTDIESLTQIADQCLLSAKQQGRNRIVVPDGAEDAESVDGANVNETQESKVVEVAQ